jgi:hypothetical protein
MSSPRRFPPSIRRVADDLAPEEPSVDEKLESLSDDERQVLAKVTDIVRRIKFGTVVLVIQDGKVVQIEMAEKFRLR